jgi:phosphoserine phosphatase
MPTHRQSAGLPSWNDGSTRRAILDFLEAADALPVGQRVAVFDNDGTLWCEKPNYIQLLFLLDELHRAVEADPALADRDEYRALLDDDKAKQAEVGLPAIARALVELCAGIEPAEFDRRVRAFFDAARHPDRQVPYIDMRYLPMLELIDELRAHEFSVFIVTGGGTEFVRVVGQEFYGVDPERVVGSLLRYEVHRDDRARPVLVRTTELFGQIDEGEAKVANLQMGLGRRPILAAGNTAGDADMLDYALTSDGPSLALLVDHDDDEREYAYVGEAASFESKGPLIGTGAAKGWTIISMRSDWAEVFDTPRAG